MLAKCILAFLAFINPISKIFVLSTLAQNADNHDIRQISIQATAFAGIILILFALLGNFILQYIFHVDIFAFQIVGGLVLLSRGFQALNRGLFFEVEINQKLEHASIVPLACPMIAGPATLTAAITFPAEFGMPVTLAAIILALAINLVVMLSAQKISGVLKKFNLMGAFIRITGLIVATIGVQMVLNGTAAYIATL